MSANQQQAQIRIQRSSDYRENYANSVQVRVSVWDFYLAFGIVQTENVEQPFIENMQGLYISPQQAKALVNVLSQNVNQYEQTFGEIILDAQQEQQAQQGSVQ